MVLAVTTLKPWKRYNVCRLHFVHAEMLVI